MRIAPNVLLVAVVVSSMILAACGSASTPAPGASASPAASSPAASVSQPAEKPKVVSPDERRAQWIEGAKKEGTLNWWGTTAPEEAVKIVAEFNEKYPFIKVEYWRGNGEAVASKLEAEALSGRISADVVLGGEPINYPRWVQMGLLGKFTDIIPGIEKWHKLSYDPQGYWAMQGGSVATSQYNTKLVSAAEAPKKWEDLLDPKWRGQIGVVTDMKTWYTLALGEGGWGVQKTTDFMTKLKEQKPVFSKGHSEGHAMLIAGDVKILAIGYLQHVLVSQKKGAPVEWVKNEPLIFHGSSMTMMTKAPNPNAARLFLEWVLSPTGLQLYDDLYGKGSPFAGSGTGQAKAVEGLSFVSQDENVIRQASEQKLDEKLLEAVGGM